MNFENGIIAYLPHKYRANAREKNNILCYNETFKGRAKNAKQNHQSKHKKGAYLWKTKIK
ncbi:type I restriction endonuclease subunit M [Helicobacter pylori]|nr:type I restriction endonuclease subunit M [Helicobacter pylori]